MPSLSLPAAVTCLCILAWVADRWRKYRRALALIGNYPGLRLVFGPSSYAGKGHCCVFNLLTVLSSVMGNILPRIRHVSAGNTFFWESKHHIFDRVGSEIYGFAFIFPPTSTLMVADSGAMKHMSYPQISGFRKHPEDYAILNQFGSNLLVTEGEEWKRQRRICAPAFSDASKNNRLVWSTAKEFTNAMVDTWASGKPIFVHDVCEDATTPLALCVIAKAGFGKEVQWGNDSIPEGYRLSFKEALLTVSSNMVVIFIMPNWAWGLRKSWRDVRLACDELKIYLRKMIDARRETKEQGADQVTGQKHDLFNLLIHARDANDKLSEDELIGNIWVFLVAGHETTGHTMAIALGLLALYPEAQDKLVQQIKQLESEHGNIALILSRRATTDTTLTFGHGPNARTIHVPASTHAYMLPTGLHYSPSYWDEPEEFKPDRFMDPHWNRDAFVAFSLGPRACIGRRFAETTLVAGLSVLISKYQISIDESRFKPILGESMTERRTRLIRLSVKLTLTPAAIPLIFTPRT
ncbi:Cytochrome P450 family protein [Ceratobasidium theobromae]|uniref:Cytochrome P450 family protein n=1 Tax=Ceratobasidium theobromae TaxID=1582974 RepID=A0A5N5QCT2_9AGAM|nr:Cytochrome P450 family protein [Ceratobasidium theobromae]